MHIISTISSTSKSKNNNGKNPIIITKGVDFGGKKKKKKIREEIQNPNPPTRPRHLSLCSTLKP
jgi:hypothetical protein